ncbi:hypothetical protein AC249_AIPGENE12232 [Exaiptasia diaphana]|nr:hypothetical protein AC249_AIPGENE12232 [Exaiptasia diaphana]
MHHNTSLDEICTEYYDEKLGSLILNNETIMQLRQRLFSISCKIKYWVGINTRVGFIFKTHGGKVVPFSKEMTGIVDLSNVTVPNVTYCLAITKNDEKLKPMPCSTPLSYICPTVDDGDFCSEQSVLYTIVDNKAFPKRKWKKSKDICTEYYGGFLGHVINNETFMELHKKLYSHPRENNTEKYWMGNRCRKKKQICTIWDEELSWKDPKDLLMKSVNFSVACNDNNRYCLAISRQPKLILMPCCTRLSYICQTIVNGPANHFCPNQSVSYTFIERECKYVPKAIWTVSGQKVFGQETLERLRKILYTDSAENHTEYWVGIKYMKESAGQHRWRFYEFKHLWDINTITHNQKQALIEIIDHSNVIVEEPYCLAITNNDKLKPMSCSKTLSYICPTAANGIPSATKSTESTTAPLTTTKRTTYTSISETTKSTETTEMTTAAPAYSTTATTSTQKILTLKTTTTTTNSGISTSINPTTKQRSAITKSTASARPKMSLNEKIEKLLNIVRAMKFENSSILERNKGVKANVMKIAEAMEEFGIKYARRHLKKLKKIAKKIVGLVFEMQRVTSKMRIVFPSDSKQSDMSTTINLPDSLFDATDRYMVNALFSEMTDNILDVTLECLHY